MRHEHSYIGKNLFILQRYFRIFLNCRLREYGINFAQFMVLQVLRRKDGLSQEAINEELCFNKGFLAKTAKYLEKKGYITRKVNQEDRRAYKLFLTHRAKSFMPTILAILNEWDNTILEDVTEEEIQVLGKTLEGMLQRVILKCKAVKEGI